MDTAALPQGPRPGDRNTTFFEDPVTDHLLRGLLTLSMELSVTRERLASLEALLADAGLLDRSQIDAFEPSAEDSTKREEQRRNLVEAILAPLAESLSRAGEVQQPDLPAGASGNLPAP